MTTASPQAGEFLEMTSAPALAVLAELYERHCEAVFRAALRVTGNPADAQDVLQTVFLRVLSRRDDDDAEDVLEAAPAAGGRRGVATYPAAYFRRAAVNAAVDILRRRAARAETAYDDHAPHAAFERPLLLKEQLRRAVATLDSEDATMFLLRHVEGLSIDELASAFSLEKNNISVRLHRIRRQLQIEMER